MVEMASATAVWYSTGLFAVPVRWVLIRDPKGEFKTQAILCTDLDADPKKILSWFVMRWQLEVTFQQMCRHLGFQRQRQWSEVAIRRTTPALLGLFSLVALFAHQRMRQPASTFGPQAAWYHKAHPTFADALALVRKELCAPDAGGQPPTPAADPYTSAIQRFAWEEDEAARREDWSTARCAAIKKVILQEARACVLARRFV